MKSLLIKTFFNWLCIFSILITGQNFVLDYTIGSFISASAFSINSTGHIFITDDGDDSLIKLDTLGNVLKEIGGYGWSESAFDNPSDVFATTLNVLVCDKRNHRVQNFDKDLNFISGLYTRESKISEERFGYPLSCVLSTMGDLYVLDSENKRILKFDLFGNFIQNFGGFDAGIYSLKIPKMLAVDAENSIYVLDDSLLLVYDQFGNGKRRVQLNNSFSNIKNSSGFSIYNNEKEIYIGTFQNDNFVSSKINLIDNKEELKIISSTIFNKKLYILTPKEIYIFKIIE